ncbi:carbohydrate-binding domain-containing protein [Micromonospora chokoriensis]
MVAVVGGASTGGTANAAEPSQFTVVGGAIRTATGTPVPASGTNASLWGNSSYATTSVSGSGRVLIGAIGDNCQGWPTVRVTVDGVSVGQTTIVSATSYGTYPVGAAVGAGQHMVQIQLVNDFRDDSCDRNVPFQHHQSGTPGRGRHRRQLVANLDLRAVHEPVVHRVRQVVHGYRRGALKRPRALLRRQQRVRSLLPSLRSERQRAFAGVPMDLMS